MGREIKSRQCVGWSISSEDVIVIIEMCTCLCSLDWGMQLGTLAPGLVHYYTRYPHVYVHRSVKGPD
jgi:hypothetical protein